VGELQKIFEGKNKIYHDYKNKHWMIGVGSKVLSLFGQERRLFR
jgi:hypothetical protein